MAPTTEPGVKIQKALDLNPNLLVVRAHRGFAYAMKHMYPAALAEFDKIADQDKTVAPENQLVAGIVGWAYSVSGRQLDALKITKEFKDLSSRAYIDLYFPAAIYAGLNDKDEAFRLLEKAYKQHSVGMQYLRIDPFRDRVRSDPHYPELLHKLGLPSVH